MKFDTNQIKQEIKSFIGNEGLKYFIELYEKNGTVWVVVHDDKLPHSIWFHEGRQIRNHIGTVFPELYNDILETYGYNYYEDLISKLVDELIKEEIDKNK